jgi:small subunit ribosomal protein S8
VEEETHLCATLAFVEYALENLQMKGRSREFVNQAGNMDTLANMLVMIKNASQRGHESVSVPHSKLKLAVAECLKANGYIVSITEKAKKSHPILEIGLAYTANNEPKVHDVTRLSKSSKRVYVGYRDVKPFKYGHGMYVLSTPKGIMTDKEAKKEVVGGELLFSIW